MGILCFSAFVVRYGSTTRRPTRLLVCVFSSLVVVFDYASYVPTCLFLNFFMDLVIYQHPCILVDQSVRLRESQNVSRPKLPGVIGIGTLVVASLFSFGQLASEGGLRSKPPRRTRRSTVYKSFPSCRQQRRRLGPSRELEATSTNIDHSSRLRCQAGPHGERRQQQTTSIAFQYNVDPDLLACKRPKGSHFGDCPVGLSVVTAHEL